MKKAHQRYLLPGLVGILAFVGSLNVAQAQWSGTKIDCSPSTGGTVEVNNVTPGTGAASLTNFTANVGCRSWHVSDPANNLTTGGYCIGIPVVGAETVDRRRAYLNGVVGGPYIEFQFVYQGGGAPYIGSGEGGGGWGAVNYGTSSGSTTMPPVVGTGYSLGSNNETLAVRVPPGQSSSSIVAGKYISEPHMMRLWSGTSDTNDTGYLQDAKNWENCQSTFPNSVPKFFGPVTVEINVVNSCTVSATDIDFGEFMSPVVVSGSVPMKTGQITVECTTADAYSIKLDGGRNSGDIQNRVMSFGSIGSTGERIRYQIYHAPGTSNVWGDTDATRHVENPGFLGTKTFTLNAVIPAQSAPASTGGLFPTGEYFDQIKVLLESYP